MSDFSIIAVAIGLIFTFAILSIFTTSISTLISQFANTRARNLKSDLKEFVGDGKFSEAFFAYPLINLSMPKPLPENSTEAEKKQPDPAEPAQEAQASNPHITKPNLLSRARATRQLLVKTGYRSYRRWDSIGKFEGGLLGALLGFIWHEYVILTIGWIISLFTDKQILVYANDFFVGKVAGQILSALVFGLLGACIGGFTVKWMYGRSKKSLGEFFSTTRVEHLEKEIFANTLLSLNDQLLPNEPPAQALEALYQGLPAGEAQDDKRRARLHEWFEQWSTNSTTAFRRKQAAFAFFIGLILALAINADTLQIARALFEDTALRDYIRTTANSFLEDPNASGPQVTGTPVSPAITPTAEAAAPVPTQAASTDSQALEAPSAATQNDDADQSSDNMAERVGAVTGFLQTTEQLLSAGLPIGWEYSPEPFAQLGGCASPLGQAARECDNTRNLWLFWEGNSPNYGSLIFRKIIGILLTAIAIAQGSPFWFDLLNRLVGRSSSGSEDATK